MASNEENLEALRNAIAAYKVRNSMRIHATFTGTNGSMGYLTGQEYVLQVLLRGPNNDRPEIVYADPSAKPCPYASWEAFWKNWQKIKN